MYVIPQSPTKHLSIVIAGGSVKLASSDPLAHPIIDPNFLATTWDISVLRESIKMIQRFAALPAWKDYIIGPFGDFAKAITDAQIEAYAREKAATFFHPIATASMSPKGASWGVVDPDLTVKGVEGLRIVDASVIVCVAFFNTLEIMILNPVISAVSS